MVQYNGGYYDLILYPQHINIDINSPTTMRLGAGTYNQLMNGDGKIKLVITEHIAGSGIGTPVEFTGIFGFNDIDQYEYLVVPSSFKVLHQGHWVTRASVTSPITGIRYLGSTMTDNNNTVQCNKYAAIWGEVTIPTSGLIIAYHGNDRGSTIGNITPAAMNEIVKLVSHKSIFYEITRGRAGTGTAALIKNGATDDYLPILSLKGGDTTEIAPNEGYCNIFNNEDHIAEVQAIYNDISGGLTATLGGGTTNILGYTDPDKNHLDFKTSDGKDAFIEFCKTTIELKEADNETDGIKPSIVPAIRLDYNNGEDPDWHNDLVFYTNDAQELSIPEDEDFIGWNTKYNGKGDWYGSEEHNGIRTAKKVNITMRDADDISENQNTNIGILYAIYKKITMIHGNY